MAARVCRTDADLDLARWRLQARQIDVSIADLKVDHAVVTIDDESGVFWARLDDNPADGSPCWWVLWHFEQQWGPLVVAACEEAVRLGLGDIPARWIVPAGNPIEDWYKGTLKARVSTTAEKQHKYEITPAKVIAALKVA